MKFIKKISCVCTFAIMFLTYNSAKAQVRNIPQEKIPNAHYAPDKVEKITEPISKQYKNADILTVIQSDNLPLKQGSSGLSRAKVRSQVQQEKAASDAKISETRVVKTEVKIPPMQTELPAKQ